MVVSSFGQQSVRHAKKPLLLRKSFDHLVFCELGKLFHSFRWLLIRIDQPAIHFFLPWEVNHLIHEFHDLDKTKDISNILRRCPKSSVLVSFGVVYSSISLRFLYFNCFPFNSSYAFLSGSESYLWLSKHVLLKI